MTGILSSQEHCGDEASPRNNLEEIAATLEECNDSSHGMSAQLEENYSIVADKYAQEITAWINANATGRLSGLAAEHGTMLKCYADAVHAIRTLETEWDGEDPMEFASGEDEIMEFLPE